LTEFWCGQCGAEPKIQTGNEIRFCPCCGGRGYLHEYIITEKDLIDTNCTCMDNSIGCENQYYSESLKHNACRTNNTNCKYSCPF